MRVLFFVAIFTVQSFAMSHQDAFNVLHQVAGKVPMVAAEHAVVEEALNMLKVLAAEKHAQIQKVSEQEKKAAICQGK